MSRQLPPLPPIVDVTDAEAAASVRRIRKVYFGRWTPGDTGGTVLVVDCDEGGRRALAPRHDVRNHSPTGYSWGYNGSGPAQLALALLCEHLGDVALATRLYHRFKSHVVSRLETGAAWLLTDHDIDDAVRVCLYEEADSR